MWLPVWSLRCRKYIYYELVFPQRGMAYGSNIEELEITGVTMDGYLIVLWLFWKGAAFSFFNKIKKKGWFSWQRSSHFIYSFSSAEYSK